MNSSLVIGNLNILVEYLLRPLLQVPKGIK